MNWAKIRTIMVKEWVDTFRNKMVFFTLIFMPLLFTILPLVNLYAMSVLPPESAEEDLGPFLAYREYFHLDNLETVMVGMASMYIIIYLVLPLMLPMMIACDSIVSEKVGKSLEPLLATPVSVSELLVGKALAAVLPAVGATWLSYAVYVGLAAVLLGRPAVVAVLASPDWLIGIGLLSPLLGLLG